MRFPLKRVLFGAAAISLAAAALVPIVADPADATPGAQPAPTIAPFPVATRTTTFSFTNSVTCDGTGASGWRANTFIVDENVDPSTLDFSVSGAPAGFVGVDFDSTDGTIAAPLYKGTEDAGVNFLPATSPAGNVAAANFAGFTFDPSVWTLTDGDYQIGFACVDGPGTVKQWWTRTVHVDANATPLAFLTEPVEAPEPTPVASCSGMKGLGSLKSTTINPVTLKPYGITDADNMDVAVSVKGIDPTVNKGTNYGSCNFAAGLSTPDGQKPANKGYSGNKAITKWSSKLFSPEADCNTLDTTDLTEWPINGSFSLQFDIDPVTLKANKSTINVTVDGFSDPDNNPSTPSDVVEGRGLATKGVAAGADATFGVYFEPVLQDKLQTTNTPHFGYNFDLAAAAGCTTPAGPGVDANITTVVIGDGASPLLGLPASGINFTIGGHQ